MNYRVSNEGAFNEPKNKRVSEFLYTLFSAYNVREDNVGYLWVSCDRFTKDKLETVYKFISDYEFYDVMQSKTNEEGNIIVRFNPKNKKGPE